MIWLLALLGLGSAAHAGPVIAEAPTLAVDADDLAEVPPARVGSPSYRGGIIGRKRRARASGRHDWRRRSGCRS